jgi:hypothetical protein
MPTASHSGSCEPVLPYMVCICTTDALPSSACFHMRSKGWHGPAFPPLETQQAPAMQGRGNMASQRNVWHASAQWDDQGLSFLLLYLKTRSAAQTSVYRKTATTTGELQDSGRHASGRVCKRVESNQRWVGVNMPVLPQRRSGSCVLAWARRATAEHCQRAGELCSAVKGLEVIFLARVGAGEVFWCCAHFGAQRSAIGSSSPELYALAPAPFSNRPT